MPIHFDWDEHNLFHIAQHGVTPVEAKEAYIADPLPVKREERNGETRRSYVGRASSGRILFLVVTPRHNKIRCVTAFPADRSWRKIYAEKRRTTSMSKLKMPDFATEAEEAAWWFDNQDALAQEYAEENGMEFLLVEKEDAALVQARAEAMGLSAKAYIKQLLHSDQNQKAA